MTPFSSLGWVGLGWVGCAVRFRPRHPRIGACVAKIPISCRHFVLNFTLLLMCSSCVLFCLPVSLSLSYSHSVFPICYTTGATIDVSLVISASRAGIFWHLAAIRNGFFSSTPCGCCHQLMFLATLSTLDDCKLTFIFVCFVRARARQDRVGDGCALEVFWSALLQPYDRKRYAAAAFNAR